MQKKIIALAIASAISAPAFADNANVTLYGKVIVDGEYVKNDKTFSNLTTKSNASRFGVKGHEDLGGGLSAIYQLEAQFDGTGEGGNGFGNGTRNSQIGLKSEDLGTAFAGKWDTPYKLAHNKIELFDNTTSFTALNLLGVSKLQGTNWGTRQSNVAMYLSPKIAGFQVAASFAPDLGKTATQNKQNLSLSGTYEDEALYAAVAYESRKDQSTVTTTDSALRLVGAYQLADLQVGATYEALTVQKSTAITYTQNNMELMGKYKFGNQTIGASYVINGEVSSTGAASTANTGASQLALRYGFNFSKRTELFLAYASLANQSAANYSLTGLSTAANTIGSTLPGSTQTVLGLGGVHSF